MRRSWLRLFWAGVVICGAIVGYLVSTGAGDRLLHHEIETQLSRLLAGPVEIAKVDLRFEDGLRIEAHGFEAYPNPDGGVPALRASRVLAWIDILAILVGRLELSTLILEGPQLRIEQRADGSFVGLPLPSRVPKPDLQDESEDSFVERVLRQLESLDATARSFVVDFRAADRIEIVDGAATWLDHGSPDAEGRPRELRLELVSGLAVRDWLSDSVTVDARAVFVDGRNTPFPVEIGIHREATPEFTWTASFSQIPLEAAQTPLTFIESSDELAGKLDIRFTLTTSEAPISELTVEGEIHDATFRLRRSGSPVEQDRVEFTAEIELDSDELRISNGRLTGETQGFEFKGTIDRPILGRSLARIEARILEPHFSGIRDLAQRFETQFDIALAIAQLTESVEAGKIRFLEAGGTASLERWFQLANGRSRELPAGFRFSGGIDKVLFDTGGGELIEELAVEVEWLDDRIALKNLSGLFRGKRLPVTNATFEGVSHLLRANETTQPLRRTPPPIPGVQPLLRIFEPRDPTAPGSVRAIGLAIDHLDHPIFRFPLRDLRVLVEPLRSGMQMNIREGTWGGAAIEGDVVYFSDPNAASVNARFTLAEAPIPTEDHDGAQALEPAWPESRWGSGRFEMQFRPRPTLPFETATGFFRFDDAELIGQEIEVQLSPLGKAAIRTKIDLRDGDSVGLDLSFAITDASLEGMSEFVALPPDLATGTIGATGSMAGRVRPDASFIAELDGSVRIEAENGLVRLTLPLLLRLGKATAGYNPFANADEIDYRSMAGTLEIEHGRLRMEDFELEGPLLVYANVRLDTNHSPGRIRAIVGIFLFRAANQILGSIPLLKSFLPGSDRGLIGAYFKVKGPVDEPDIDALAMKTLMASVPDAIKAPFTAMQFLFGSDGDDP